jgi:hypothetical protein
MWYFHRPRGGAAGEARGGAAGARREPARAARSQGRPEYCADFTMVKCYLVTAFHSKIRPKMPRLRSRFAGNRYQPCPRAGPLTQPT